MKDQNSKNMIDFLKNGGIPVSLNSKMFNFRDSNKSFKLDVDLLDTKKIYDFNVTHSNPKNQKLVYEFGKETNYNFRQKGRKSNRDKSLIRILKSPAIMASETAKIFTI